MNIYLSIPDYFHTKPIETHILGMIKSCWPSSKILNLSDNIHKLGEGKRGVNYLFDLIFECEIGIFMPHRYHFDENQKWAMEVFYRLGKSVYFTDGFKTIKINEEYALLQ